MHKRLVAGLGLVGLLVAGCGDGGALSSPEESSVPPPSAPAPTTEAESQRSAPAKAVSIPDKCSIITEPQQQELGVDQPPEEHAYSGRNGCIYEKSDEDTGWQIFVAVNGDTSYTDEVKKRSNPEEAEVSGYPVSVYEDNTGCLLYADISDDGFLIANANKMSMDGPNVNVCEQGEKFIEAAVKNLPDA